MRFLHIKTYLIIFITLISYFFFPIKSQAILIGGNEYNNLRGWAWSLNIGWISFSCHRAEAVSAGGAAFGGSAEVANCANIWGAHIVQTSEAPALGYAPGAVIGRAWSDNIGWISFMRSETGDPPLTGNSSFDSVFQGKNYIAMFDPATRSLYGWARVLSACKSDPATGKPNCALGLNDPVWDGWIYFPNTSSGVKISDGTPSACGVGYNAGDWCGYAWGGFNVGWIEFVKDTTLAAASPSVVTGGIAGNSPPVADMVLNPSVVMSASGSYVGDLIYDGTGSSDPDFGDTITFFWDFGDGTTSTNPSGMHTYSSLGTYTVTLTVTDSHGASDSVSQVITFTNPGALNLCTIPCASDADCPSNSYCMFTTPGAVQGVCVLKPGVSASSSPAALGGSLNAYVCTPDVNSEGVLSKCEPEVEVCSSSGTYPSNGDVCSPGSVRVVPTSVSTSGFVCGVDVNVIGGPYCVGDKFVACPSNGQCPGSGNSCTPGNFECQTSTTTPSVYVCSKQGNVNPGVPISSAIPPLPEIPLLPKGIQPGGEACTKPTQDAPVNCQGINGCMYYGYDNAGNQKSDIVTIANCIGNGQLNLNGCFYNAGSVSGSLCDSDVSTPSLCKVNVCENRYPLGCSFYNYNDSANPANSYSLANCLPGGSYAGIPSSSCKEVSVGNDKYVDCRADTSSSGGGCIFYSDGRIDCTDPAASGKPYAGYIFYPNKVEYVGVKTPPPLSSLDTYYQCALSDINASSLAQQNSCSSDGSCPVGSVCIAGTCMNKCSTGGPCGPGGVCPSGLVCNTTTNTCENPSFNPSDKCSLGTTCTGLCPSGYFWDVSTGACLPIDWAKYPVCSNAYLKTSTTSPNKLSISDNLPTGTTQIYLFTQSPNPQNCRFSTNPLASFASMIDFDFTSSTTSYTLLSGLSPLPSINLYLVRCQDVSNPLNETACRVGIKVGTPCGPGGSCSVGVCSAGGICTIPACSGASPSGVLPAGTTNTTISMNTSSPSSCKYSDTLYDASGNPVNFNTMTNNMSSVGVAGTSHFANVSGLVSGYNDYYVQCKDNSSSNLSPLCRIDFTVNNNPWYGYPVCSNAYLKTSTTSPNKLSISDNLPTGTTQIYLFTQSPNPQNCRFSTNPLASFASMTDFSLGGVGLNGSTTDYTLLSGLFSGVNRFLIRCQDPVTSNITSCMVGIKVGTPCGPGGSCSVGVCSAGGICTIPACSGASPSGVLPAGTTNTTISMNTSSPSSCKYSDTLYDASGNLLTFSAMTNLMTTATGTSHSAFVSGLSAGYNAYYVKCKENSSGNVSNFCRIDFTIDTSNSFPCGSVICPTGMACINGSCSPLVSLPSSTCPFGTVFDPITGNCVSPSVSVPVVVNPACDILGLSFHSGVAPGTGIGPAANCSITQLIVALIYWIAWIVAVLAVIYGLRGAYTYITANGDSQRLELAKRYLVYTVVGIIVALLSFGIVALAKDAFGL